jgi:di/tripeptidase
VVSLGNTDTFKVGLRSSKQIENTTMLNYFNEYAKNNSFKFNIGGINPGFESDINSKLIKVLLETYNIDYYKKKPSLSSAHITVELGIFKEKMPDLDVAIIAPNIQNCHSIHEKVEIASVYAMDTWLRNFIKKF